MPDREVIEDFKLLINSLGNEPTIVSDEGGVIEDVPFSSSENDLSTPFAVSDDDFDLDDHLDSAVGADDKDEFVPDLGGFDFGEDDNPFGDLGDFNLDDVEETEDPSPPDNFESESLENLDENFIGNNDPSSVDLNNDNEQVDDFSFSDIGSESEIESEDDFSFSDLDNKEEPFSAELEDEFSFNDSDSEENHDILPETMGDLFEDGSEEAIPDFVPSDDIDDELEFDDFTLDVQSPDQEEESSNVEELENLEIIDDLEEAEDVEELIPVDNDDAIETDDLNNDKEEEISLGDDFDSDFETFDDLDYSQEEEQPPLDDFDMSPGDFGDSAGFEDYSFGEELEAIDEMKEESPVDESFQLTEEQFDQLKKNLSLLPKNLKLAIEEILVEGKLKGKKYEKLIMLLVQGASPKNLVDYILKTINKKIKLPSGYIKRSGSNYEQSKNGFLYLFSHHTWPKLKWIILGITGAWILFLLSLFFIYRPVHAGNLYKKGYEGIYFDQYESANSLFETAWDGWYLGPYWIDGWQDKNWFYKYADAYIDRRQFIEAAQKYDELINFYPGDIKGLMDYAHMETFDTARYKHAEELLKNILAVKVNDYRAMLSLGDNYFEWSDEDPSKLEDARFVYATLLDDKGGKNEILFRMLRYFLRRNDHENIMRLKNTFQQDKSIALEPRYFSTVYSELGGYLIDKGMQAEALTVLLRAESEFDEIPDVHYELARYFRRNEDDKMEELALRKVLFYLDHQTPLKKDKIFMKLDTHRRRGELKFRKEEFLDAENEYRQGVALYENSIKRNLIGASSTGGKLYADLGDLYYRNHDYLAALNMYDKAETNRFITPQIEYHRGYSNYITGDYERALLEFYNSDQGLPGNRNVLFALGNTMLKRGNYYGAQSSFTRVINLLKEEEKNIDYLMIDEKVKHRALIELYSKAYNNLGISYYNLAKSSADVDKISSAMVCFAKSSDYSDLLTRDDDTYIRSDAPKVFNSADEYVNKESNNIIDKNGYQVETEYIIPLHTDDILF